MKEFAQQLFKLEFLSDDGFNIDINSPKFKGIDINFFQILENNKIITHKGFAEKIECCCGGLLEETLQDGIYFCAECESFEKINQEQRIYKVCCESIFIMIKDVLSVIVNQYKELETFIPSNKGFFQNETSPIGFLKNVDLEIYFLHKQHHAQNFKKQNDNSKILIFTPDGGVANFADYYISCGNILNDKGLFSLEKINAELFQVLYKVYQKCGSKKEAAKFYTLYLLKSESKKYKFHGGREKFIQDMMRDFQGVKQDFIEKLWNEFTR